MTSGHIMQPKKCGQKFRLMVNDLLIDPTAHLVTILKLMKSLFSEEVDQINRDLTLFLSSTGRLKNGDK